MVRSELDEVDKDHHKGRSKDKDRSKDRDRDVDRDRDEEDRARDRDRDRNKEREKARDREKERDHREKEKEKTKDRERERAEKEKSKDRDRDKEKDREREKEREKDRDREKERDGAKDREKDRDRDSLKDREKEKERERDKERERERERNREKEDKKKDRAKDRGDGGRDRDADSGKDKRKDKDKRERDAEKDKDRDREREKDREKDRDRDRERFKDSNRARERDHDKEREQEREREQDRDRDMEKERSKSKLREERVGDREMEAQQEKPPQEIGSGRKGDAHGKGKSEMENEIFIWVNKSRKLEDQKKIEERIKAARTARLLAEQENGEDSDSEEEDRASHTGKDLAGVKVLHGFDKVMEGGAVVLTLKDRDIITGEDVNDEIDELENAEIAEQRVRDEAYKAAKKKPGVYEDKFQNDINAVRTILPQYDEEMKDTGVALDETGSFNEEAHKKLEELKKNLQGIGQKAHESLVRATNFASDFYTQAEMLQFNKPKKKKKLRKKEVLDIDALEAEAKAEGLGAGDLGSRASGARKAMKQAEEKAAAEEARRSAYLSAYSKAVDASKKLRANSFVETTETESEEVVFGGEEDDELYKSLQRARQAALKKQTENGGFSAGPRAVVAAMKQSSETGSEVGAADEASDKDKATVVFTETEEFCRSLQLDEAIMRRPGAKDAFAGDDDEAPAMLNGEEQPPGIDGGWREVRETEDDEMPKKEEEEDVDVEESIKETAVGKGLAGALQLLKDRGSLKETVEWGGRNMDKKKSKLVGVVDQNDKFRDREILLDRLDEFGRTMTPKESFRKLSHKFHGKGPGKMKQEKRMKQYQEEMKLKQMNSGDTPLMSMEKMRVAQAKMHTPYIVISGHIKPGQTSDPRSGFATVEKESVGSLTPMLGDMKVEHFLGIKRKPEGGSMGPPPPKKPKSGT